MSGYVWLNGALLPPSEASVPIDDRGFLYGAACFETLRAFGGAAFRLGRHLDRLEAGLRAMGVEPPPRDGGAGGPPVRVRAHARPGPRVPLTVSAGTGGARPGLGPAGAPLVLVTAQPVPESVAPARALVARGTRVTVDRPLPFAKTVNYLGPLLALEEARRAGLDQALLLDLDGDVVEASTANVFAVLGGEDGDSLLVTPPLEAGALPGVTREAVLECARGLRIEAAERRLPLAELLAAREALLTNSIVGVQPLAELRDGERSHHFEAPGPVTRALAAAYREAVARECGVAPSA
ncbi:MAG: 2-keto-4-methylthiobutyrate aminotransferase [Chloroflexi bacterium]|nr:2-keto-4-methylthiobutyrate aminotransferase [Chloroflexota bacterium]